MIWEKLAGKLEGAAALDPAVEAVAGVAGRVLPRGPLKDALHGRWLGHPVHPLLVAMPIGMWTGANLLDLTAGEKGRAAARRMVGAGLLAVGPTAAAGLADWSELGLARRPKRVGLVHALANSVAASLYLGSWLARRQGRHARGRNLALAGSTAMMVGGYLGGHLSYSNAVGVNRLADREKQPTDWTDATEVDDVVVVDGEGGRRHAMAGTCSHLGGPLGEGRVVDGCVECPWHQSRFRLADGSVARGPATAPQLSYDTRTDGDRTEVRART